MQLCACVFTHPTRWLSNEGFCWSVSEKHKTEQSQIEWFHFILLLSLSASLIVLGITLALPIRLLEVLIVCWKYVAGAISQSVVVFAHAQKMKLNNNSKLPLNS